MKKLSRIALIVLFVLSAVLSTGCSEYKDKDLAGTLLQAGHDVQNGPWDIFEAIDNATK